MLDLKVLAEKVATMLDSNEPTLAVEGMSLAAVNQETKIVWY